MKRDVLLSIIDHAMVSAFNLALNLSFIAFAAPSEFGRFVLILAGAYFAISAQNALVVMPLNYLIPGRKAEEAAEHLSMLTSANMALTTLIVPASLGLGALIQADTTLSIAILAFFFATMLREFARNAMIVQGVIARTLIYDAIAMSASAIAVLALWPLIAPEAAALGGMALGNLVAIAFNRSSLAFSPSLLPGHLKTYRDVWKETRWALQGALQNEVEARSYVFLAEHWRDAATLGMLQAGRVAISPLLLISAAWRRVARPKIVEELHNARPDRASKVLRSGAILIAAGTVVYGLSLAAAWPALETFVFKNRYGDMTTIVAAWWLYAFIVGMAAVAATLLEARRQFRALAAVGFAVASLILLSFFGLLFVDFEVSTIVMVLCGVHIVELVVYCLMIRRNAVSSTAGAIVPEPGR